MFESIYCFITVYTMHLTNDKNIKKNDNKIINQAKYINKAIIFSTIKVMNISVLYIQRP